MKSWSTIVNLVWSYHLLYTQLLWFVVFTGILHDELSSCLVCIAKVISRIIWCCVIDSWDYFTYPLLALYTCARCTNTAISEVTTIFTNSLGKQKSIYYRSESTGKHPIIWHSPWLHFALLWLAWEVPCIRRWSSSIHFVKAHNYNISPSIYHISPCFDVIFHSISESKTRRKFAQLPQNCRAVLFLEILLNSPFEVGVMLMLR